MLVRTLRDAVNLQFARVQFTPDLMPADIIGTNVIMEDEHGRKGFEFQAGPIFANILLADEINRATPKTQSALLEAMQEHHVTVGGVQHRLDEPVPRARHAEPAGDGRGPTRFPRRSSTAFSSSCSSAIPRPTICTPSSIAPPPASARSSRRCSRRAVRGRSARRRPPGAAGARGPVARHPLVMATHPRTRKPRRWPSATSATAQPRGAQALILAAKIYALLDGRYHVAKATSTKPPSQPCATASS
jgi:MoxR-like ATPase